MKESDSIPYIVMSLVDTLLAWQAQRKQEWTSRKGCSTLRDEKTAPGDRWCAEIMGNSCSYLLVLYIHYAIKSGYKKLLNSLLILPVNMETDRNVPSCQGWVHSI